MRAEEEYYKNQALQQYRESQELERMNDQKRRLAILKMKEESEKEVERARKLREEEEMRLRQEEEQAMQQGWYDEEAKQMAKEERAKLIRNCAAQVFHYLDGGKLHPEDLENLPPELQEQIR